MQLKTQNGFIQHATALKERLSFSNNSEPLMQHQNPTEMINIKSSIELQQPTTKSLTNNESLKLLVLETINIRYPEDEWLVSTLTVQKLMIMQIQEQEFTVLCSPFIYQ